MSDLEKELIDLRIKIDSLDEQIVKLLNKRVDLANTIGSVKRKLGLPVYVPEREDEVIQNIQKMNSGPLSSEALKRLYERIIDETRRLEQEDYAKK